MTRHPHFFCFEEIELGKANDFVRMIADEWKEGKNPQCVVVLRDDKQTDMGKLAIIWAAKDAKITRVEFV